MFVVHQLPSIVSCDVAPPRVPEMKRVCLHLVKHLLAIVSPDLVLVQDLQRPLYMQAQDAIQYNIIDRIVKPESELYGEVKKPAQWDKDAGLVERPAPGQGMG